MVIGISKPFESVRLYTLDTEKMGARYELMNDKENALPVSDCTKKGSLSDIMQADKKDFFFLHAVHD